MKRRDQIQGELDSKVEALAYKKADTDLVSSIIFYIICIFIYI